MREKTRVTNTISIRFRVVFLAHGTSTALPSACAGAAKKLAGATLVALGVVSFVCPSRGTSQRHANGAAGLFPST